MVERRIAPVPDYILCSPSQKPAARDAHRARRRSRRFCFRSALTPCVLCVSFPPFIYIHIFNVMKRFASLIILVTTQVEHYSSILNGCRPEPANADWKLPWLRPIVGLFIIGQAFCGGAFGIIRISYHIVYIFFF